MIAFLLTLLLIQGIPALQGETGKVSGVVRTSAGLPAVGVRVLAMVPPDPAANILSASSFTALAETDALGRYQLEGLPSGRYYIVAGRVDLLTYFPGTTDMSMARIFSIAAGGSVSGVDFSIVDSSIRLASSADPSRPLINLSTIPVPIHVRVEGGGKIPVSAPGGFLSILLVDVPYRSLRTQTIKDSATLSLSLQSSAPEFRVSIANLPDGYIVKSMSYGANDVLTQTMKVPPELAPRVVVQTTNGITQTIIASVPPPGGIYPELDVTLATVPVPDVPGSRVIGRIKDTELRSVYLSGTPGILYSDGTFEFRGVPPGRHSIAAIGTLRVPSLGASIVVGDRSMDGIELEPIAVLPRDVTVPSEPGAAGKHAPGTVLPLVSVRGRLLEEASGKPIEEGTLRLIGRDQSDVKVGIGGQFEFLRLLPGTYDLQVQIFGHSNVLQTINVGDEDLILDVKTLRLY